MDLSDKREEYCERNSHVLARMSEDAYLDPHAFASQWAARYTVRFIQGASGGAQGYALADADNLVFAFRGTELNDMKDILADLRFYKVPEGRGYVHSGFQDYTDAMWEEINGVCEYYPFHRVWMCGHSLGGAIATIAAARVTEKYRASNKVVVYSYGSPRVGDATYCKSYEPIHFRHRNVHDLFTRLPPKRWGYTHTGKLVYFTKHGKRQNHKNTRSPHKRWQEWWNGIKEGVEYHDIGEYVKLCEKRNTVDQ